jgi:hypothetical protein
MTIEAANRVLTAVEKARAVNEDPRFYGSFAEIGAGQEVARWFFRAGKASATIAKTMSAYDMAFSDAIYGAEETHRYVCESRLLKMLDKEYGHIKNRIWESRGERSQFFVFADTVASKSLRTGAAGHGWLGVRFQAEPLATPSDLVVHLRLPEGSALEQQEAIGTVGVNLVYGCFFHRNDPVSLIASLKDNLKAGQIEIDMIRFTGPAFEHVDNRLMSLQLVRLGLTDAVLLSPEGQMLQPSEALYKKHLLVQRGRFRPVTRLHVDMLESAKRQFLSDASIKEEDLISIMEITINNLLMESNSASSGIDVQDFLDRVDTLSSLGQHVLISNYGEYYRFSEFLTKYTNAKAGIIMGVGHLHKIVDKSYYKDVPGGFLSSLGLLFRDNIRALIYPAFSLSTEQPSPKEASEGGLKPISAETYAPSREIRHLYQHMLENRMIQSIDHFDADSLFINSDVVLAKIKSGDPSWESQVPLEAAKVIKAKGLFGYLGSVKKTS